MDFALDFAHLETGQFKNSPNAWKLTSKTAPCDPIAAKRCEEKNKKSNALLPIMENRNIAVEVPHGTLLHVLQHVYSLIKIVWLKGSGIRTTSQSQRIELGNDRTKNVRVKKIARAKA